MHTPEISIHEKREQFAQFISFLTGEMNIEISFGGKSNRNTIVIPDLGTLDHQRIDFLYALCLREAGFISGSRRSLTSFLTLKTQDELVATMMTESARIEKMLCRRLAGARDILSHHWSEDAHTSEFSIAAFGFNPQEANTVQTLMSVVKLQLLGWPRYGWEKLFPKDTWNQAVHWLETPEALVVLQMPLRKWEDSIAFAQALLKAWHQTQQSQDLSLPFTKSEKVTALEAAQQKINDLVETQFKSTLEEQEKEAERIKKMQETLASQMTEVDPQLQALKTNIKKLQQDMAPLSHYNQTVHNVQKVQSHMNQAQEKKQHIAEQAEALKKAQQERAEKLLQKSEEAITKAAEQKEAREARDEQYQSKLEEKIQHMESKIQEANTKKEALGDSERDTEKKSKLNDKIENLEQQLANLVEKQTQAREQQQAVQQMLEDKLQQAQQRQEQATTPTQSQAERAERLKQRDASQLAELQKMQAQLEQAMAENQKAAQELESQHLGEMTPEELFQKSADMLAQLQQSNQEYQTLQEPFIKAKKEIQEAKKQMQDQNKMMNMQTHQALKAAQQEMKQQGIELQLVESMQEMEGWSQANQIQSQFDDQATQQLQEPVINGCGGGKGNRNVLERIEEANALINDIDPNELFADVAKMSPMAGLSSSGVASTQGEGTPKSHGDNHGLTSIVPHTVWSKEHDTIIPAPTRDMSVVTELRKTYAKPIKAMKALFQQKMKPTSKIKFLGGQEQGNLDTRSIWKLATGHSDDFYEVERKRFDTKVSAVILADLSGSCASIGDDATRQIQAAVLMLSEALSECKVDHEILGYHAPIDSQLMNQKIPDSFNRKMCRLETIIAKGNNESTLSGLASLQIQQTENSDGESLRIAVKRLSKRPGKRKIVFMLSDGKPYMQDADVAILDEDLRKASLEATRSKVSIVSLGFGDQAHPVFGATHAAIQSIETMAQDIESIF